MFIFAFLVESHLSFWSARVDLSSVIVLSSIALSSFRVVICFLVSLFIDTDPAKSSSNSTALRMYSTSPEK